MQRSVDKELLKWKNEPERKVLLLRGARQVGETFKYFLEINFPLSTGFPKTISRLLDMGQTPFFRLQNFEPICILGQPVERGGMLRDSTLKNQEEHPGCVCTLKRYEGKKRKNGVSLEKSTYFLV